MNGAKDCKSYICDPLLFSLNIDAKVIEGIKGSVAQTLK